MTSAKQTQNKLNDDLDFESCILEFQKLQNDLNHNSGSLNQNNQTDHFKITKSFSNNSISNEKESPITSRVSPSSETNTVITLSHPRPRIVNSVDNPKLELNVSSSQQYSQSNPGIKYQGLSPTDYQQWSSNSDIYYLRETRSIPNLQQSSHLYLLDQEETASTTIHKSTVLDYSESSGSTESIEMEDTPKFQGPRSVRKTKKAKMPRVKGFKPNIHATENPIETHDLHLLELDRATPLNRAHSTSSLHNKSKPVPSKLPLEMGDLNSVDKDELHKKLEEQANYIKHLENYSDNLKTRYALAEITIDKLRAGLLPVNSNEQKDLNAVSRSSSILTGSRKQLFGSINDSIQSSSTSLYGTLGRNRPSRSSSIGYLASNFNRSSHNSLPKSIFRSPSITASKQLDPREEINEDSIDGSVVKMPVIKPSLRLGNHSPTQSISSSFFSITKHEQMDNPKPLVDDDENKTNILHRLEAIKSQLASLEEQRKLDLQVPKTGISSSINVSSTASELRRVKQLQENLVSLQNESQKLAQTTVNQPLNSEECASIDRLMTTTFKVGLRLEELQLELTNELNRQVRKRPFTDSKQQHLLSNNNPLTQSYETSHKNGVDSLISSSTGSSSISNNINFAISADKLNALETQFTEFLQRYSKLIHLSLTEQRQRHIQSLKSNLRRISETAQNVNSTIILSPDNLEDLFTIDEETSSMAPSTVIDATRRLEQPVEKQFEKNMKSSVKRLESSISAETLHAGSGCDSGLSLGTPPKNSTQATSESSAPGSNLQQRINNQLANLSIDSNSLTNSNLKGQTLKNSDNLSFPSHHDISSKKEITSSERGDAEHSFLLRQHDEQFEQIKDSFVRSFSSNSPNDFESSSTEPEEVPYKQEQFAMPTIRPHRNQPFRYSEKLTTNQPPQRKYRASLQTSRGVFDGQKTEYSPYTVVSSYNPNSGFSERYYTPKEESNPITKNHLPRNYNMIGNNVPIKSGPFICSERVDIPTYLHLPTRTYQKLEHETTTTTVQRDYHVKHYEPPVSAVTPQHVEPLVSYQHPINPKQSFGEPQLHSRIPQGPHMQTQNRSQTSYSSHQIPIQVYTKYRHSYGSSDEGSNIPDNTIKHKINSFSSKKLNNTRPSSIYEGVNDQSHDYKYRHKPKANRFLCAKCAKISSQSNEKQCCCESQRKTRFHDLLRTAQHVTLLAHEIETSLLNHDQWTASKDRSSTHHDI